jgi:hypothetical protein
VKDGDRIETLGEVAGDVLLRMARELLARKPGGHLVDPDLVLELTLSLSLRGPEAGPRQLAQRLVRTLDDLLDDAVQQAAAFRPGHAYCHRCDAAGCEHSLPPTARHVLVGYQPTGAPRWEDFAQVCLDRKHPEVDRLYDDPPALVTLVQEAGELRRGLLRAFDNGTYQLLGQVCVGFFAVRSRAEEGRGVLALTAQAAATRARDGRFRLGLNLLGRAPDGGDLESLWDRQAELPWRAAVWWAQEALRTLAAPRRGGRRRQFPRAELQRRVDGILRGLARRLERDARSRDRRTRHAQLRHASGARPTRKAIDDAREAGPEGLMVDERSGTVVVLGDRGRTHFFTREGRLVSSVRYNKDAVARKIKLELWRPASADEAAAFRERLPE